MPQESEDAQSLTFIGTNSSKVVTSSQGDHFGFVHTPRPWMLAVNCIQL